MATWEFEVEAGEGTVIFQVFGEDAGHGAPDRPWCRDYEEVE